MTVTASETLPILITNRKLTVLSFLLGASVVVFIVVILVVASLSFAIQQPISQFHMIVAFVVTMGFAWLGICKHFTANRPFYIALLFFCLSILLVLSFKISESFYDISPEGYQYRGFYLLQEGWNPWYEPNLPAEDISIVGYTKGPWVYAAALYKLTGRIDQVKGFNILFMAAAFLISFARFSSFQKLPLWLSLLLAAILALNPVTATQLSTFYVDAQLASLITILICLVWMLADGYDSLALITVVAAVIVALNIKLSASAVVAIVLVAIGGWLLVTKAIYWKKTVMSLGLAYLLGILFIGYNPYLTNIANYGNPLFPATQWGVLYGSSNLPENFVTKNTFQKLALSTFSVSDARAKAASRLKLPFTTSRDELLVFRGPDTRIGGFGPLFGGAVLLASLTIIGRLVVSPMPWSRDDKFILVLLSAVTLSVLIVSEAWWARYVPQFWLIPVLVALLGLRAGNRLLKLLSSVLVLSLAVNCLLVMVPSVWHHLQMTAKASEQMHKLAIESLQQPVEALFDSTADEIRFSEQGINYVSVNEPACPQPVNVLNKTQVCLPAASP